MAATLDDVTKKIQPEQTAEQQAAEELLRQAREPDRSLTGPQRLLKRLTKQATSATPPGPRRC
jgi:hypothetical protein